MRQDRSLEGALFAVLLLFHHAVWERDFFGTCLAKHEGKSRDSSIYVEELTDSQIDDPTSDQTMKQDLTWGNELFLES